MRVRRGTGGINHRARDAKNVIVAFRYDDETTAFEAENNRVGEERERSERERRRRV